MSTVPIWLLTVACVFSAAVWFTGGTYKLTHYRRTVDVIRRHRIPFPEFTFWACVLVELGGAVLLVRQQWLWLTALVWLCFLAVATPIFHGRFWKNGEIDFQQLIHFTKNLSLAGGLMMLVVIDSTTPRLVEADPKQIVCNPGVDAEIAANPAARERAAP